MQCNISHINWYLLNNIFQRKTQGSTWANVYKDSAGYTRKKITKDLSKKERKKQKNQEQQRKI